MMKEKPLSLFGLIAILAFSVIATSSAFRSSTTNFTVPTLYIDPQTTVGGVNETFSISVSIAEVTDLYGWEFKLYYIKHVLNATAVHEGSFLKAAGLTYFTGGPSETGGILNNYNATHGRIHVWCTLLGEIPGVNGRGELAVITFQVIELGNSDLTLGTTFLVDSMITEISHERISGLFTPEELRNIAVTNIAPSKTVIGQGYLMSINVTVENQGHSTETFNVSVYANSTTIETKETTLTSGDFTTITFTWDTTNFPKGNYTISAYASPVPSEPDTADNTLLDGWVFVATPGDVNADGTVNILDIALIARAFGSSLGNPSYDPNCDINCDGTINILDIAAAAKNFGKTDP